MTELHDLVKNPDKFRVLVVDDKAPMRRTIRNMLRALGFTNIREASDGREALKRIRGETFDFVFSDWHMPHLTGVDLLRSLREDDNFRTLPFIMVTASVEEEMVAEVIEADVDGYIIKPFKMETLKEKVIEILTAKFMPSPLESQLQVAEICIKGRSFGRAHEEIDKAARISPNNPRVHFARGQLFEAQGRLDLAERSYAQSWSAGPKYIKAMEKLSEVFEKRGKADEALMVLKKACELSSRNPDRLTRLGMLHLMAGHANEARESFGQALKLDPGNGERQTAIGEAYMKQGLHQDAEVMFKASIESDPYDVFKYNRLGIACRQQKKFEEAIGYYQKALEIDPDEKYLHYNLALAYVGAGKKSEADKCLGQAIRLDPEFQEALEVRSKMQRGPRPGPSR
ncbi:MAG: tetratricopeptide repeat protein [Proteobacteria bacterium]|nr:tetratricopeptide repeat protein [Pseudomonadota bacterium]